MPQSPKAKPQRQESTKPQLPESIHLLKQFSPPSPGFSRQVVLVLRDEIQMLQRATLRIWRRHPSTQTYS